MIVHCRINGVDMSRQVEPRLLLSDFLRHHLGLTATHVGCEVGACGACNVLLDGAAVRSCLLFAAQVDGHTLTTVEGLEGIGDVRARFVAERAFQCGFCTAGFLVSVAELEPWKLALSDAETRAALVGSVCRCTGYNGLVAAVRAGS